MTARDRELVISGGGRVRISTDVMLAAAESLAAVAESAGQLRASAAEMCARLPPYRLVALAAPASALTAGWRLDEAVEGAARLQRDAAELAADLARAAARYGATDAALSRLVRALSERVAYSLGSLAPFLLATLLPVFGTAIASAVLSRVFWGGTGGEVPASDLTGERPEDPGSPEGAQQDSDSSAANPLATLLTDPGLVALLQHSVMSVDDFLGGMLRIPQPLGSALGDQGLGVTGLDTSITLVIAVAALVGGLKETGVVTTRAGPVRPGVAATSIADRAARIPHAGQVSAAPGLPTSTPTTNTQQPRMPQVRVERYEIPGQRDRFAVYVAGTVDFAVQGGSEPWDMTSNVHGVAGLDPASYQAVRQAMLQAGVTAESPVQLSGYSQGGLVATLVAASGEFDVHSLVTFGSPSGQIPVPPEVATLTVRHTDDLVPATGGYDVNTDALVVERHLFGGQAIPADVAVPAHQLSNYERTAGLIDAAASSDLRSRVEQITGFTRGATAVETSDWAATRSPQPPHPTPDATETAPDPVSGGR